MTHRRIFLDERSWVDVFRKAFPLTPSQFEEVWSGRPPSRATGTMMGKAVQFPRFTKAYGEDYPFAGQIALSTSPLESVPHFDLLASFVEGKGYNGALINYYDASSGDYIGPHSDDERDLVRGHDILSLTWATEGHFRRFRLTPKKRKGGGEGGARLVLDLSDGDVVVMGGDCQATHKHEIMPVRKTQPREREGRRVNVTFRRFHGRAR